VTYENVVVDVDGPVATITLNRPEKLNALSPGLLNDLGAALRELNPGDDVRVVRLRGAGRAFCPGYDLDPAANSYGRPRSKGARGTALADHGESSIALDREGLREGIDRWLWIWNYRKPIIAQTHTYCLSGGLDLIGVCDIVFAAEGTLFGHPAARGLGIPMTLGMLPVKIGAMNPLDALTVHKHVTNRWLEVMGLRLAALEGAEYDAIFHLTPANAEFGRRSREDGLREALAWRDGPYSTGPAADHDAAVRRKR
jgi:enoyl-CoA hydratase